MTEHVEPPPPYPGEFLRAVVGSSVHGLSVGSDDLDLMGIRIESMSEAIPLNGKPFEQKVWRSAGGNNPSQPGDVDLVVYGLRKWLKLACAGNPTILLPLFAPVEACIGNDLAWELRTKTDLIISARAGQAFLGYMEQQRQRLMGIRGQKRSGKIRQDLIDAHGHDTKYAGHIVRLGLQGIELMSTGRLSLPMQPKHCEEILAVRRGEQPLSYVIDRAEELEATLRHAITDTQLRDQPDTERLGIWMRHQYHRRWA